MTKTDLNPLLHLIYDDSRSGTEREEAMGRLRAELLTPRLILDVLPSGDPHPLREEALWISDAFEAVTNGMADSGILANLDRIGSASPLHPWVGLIRGIRALYMGETTGALHQFGLVDPASPPGLLASALSKGLSAGIPGQMTSLYSPAEQEFLKGLFRDERVVRDAFEQLETCHDSGLGSLLTDTFLLLLKELADRDPDLVRRVFHWGIRRWEETLLDDERFVPRIRVLFGRAAGLQLLSEALRVSSPDRSLVFLLESFEALLREVVPDAERIKQYRCEADALWQEIESNYEVEESYLSWCQDRRNSIDQHLKLLVGTRDHDLLPAMETPLREQVEPARYVQLDLFG